MRHGTGQFLDARLIRLPRWLKEQHMYVVNGVAYAGEPQLGMKVAKAKVVNTLSMLVTFSTGETRLFDASKLVEKPAFAPLAVPETFRDFAIERGVVTWLEGDIDLSPEAMYEMSFPYERVA